jgi:hypothetical protein
MSTFPFESDMESKPYTEKNDWAIFIRFVAPLLDRSNGISRSDEISEKKVAQRSSSIFLVISFLLDHLEIASEPERIRIDAVTRLDALHLTFYCDIFVGVTCVTIRK